MLDYNSLLPPWERPCAALEAQLYREVKPGHALFGLEVHALARRRDNDPNAQGAEARKVKAQKQ